MSGGEETLYDVIVRANTIHTLGDGATSPTAVAIRDGVIAAVGTDVDFADWSANATRAIDLGDATMTPGLVDNHIHPILGIQMTRGLDLTLFDTEAKVTAALREYATTLAPDAWILGWGLDLNIAEPGKLNNSFLDELVGDRPAFLYLKDAHSALASSAAIRAGEYGDDSPHLIAENPGWLVELEAMGPALAAMPQLTVADKAERLHEILRAFAEKGFTEGYVLDLGDPDAVEILQTAERLGPLEIVLRISPWIMPDGQWPTVDDVIALQDTHGERWAIEGAKLFIDGTIDNGTAWLYKPDTKGEGLAGAWHTPEQYRATVAKLHAARIPTSTHAIGDKGIDYVVETLAALPAGGPRHRIEHIETVTDEVIEGMRANNITASMQPTHCTHFVYADETDNWSVRLGHERSERGFRWADIRDAGVPLAMGSDWPVAICDAPAIFASAQLCRPAGQPEVTPIRPRQALTALDVLRGFTVIADESIERAPRAIAVGQRATLTAFADDPLTTDPDAFANTSVVLTMIDGDVIVGSNR
jgi:predicted amidohydrolase YtcJ